MVMISISAGKLDYNVVVLLSTQLDQNGVHGHEGTNGANDALSVNIVSSQRSNIKHTGAHPPTQYNTTDSKLAREGERMKDFVCLRIT
ncbi:hypothetical protein Tco_1233200, partial [Tanacetum coccineum]